MDRFVCVRIVEGYGMDLSTFQFDYDLTFFAFFMNADKTIYGRFGTAKIGSNSQDVTLDGFKKALEGALELHKNYPKNKKDLAGKTGPAPAYKTSETAPLMGNAKAVKADGSAKNCMHCHLVPQKAISDKLSQGYPNMIDFGLTMDQKERATVTNVKSGTAGEKAGFAAGDKIVRLEGQPILSIADLQWVLHNAPKGTALKAELNRGGKNADLTLTR